MFTYCLNNPANFDDLTGCDAVLLFDSDNIGHVGALIQDSEGSWWHFYWGTEDSWIRAFCWIAVPPLTWCVQYTGEISLDQVNADNNYKYDYEELLYLPGDFSESATLAQNPHGLYSLFINNCSQVTLSILAASNTNYKFILSNGGRTMFPGAAFYEVKNFILQ